MSHVLWESVWRKEIQSLPDLHKSAHNCSLVVWTESFRAWPVWLFPPGTLCHICCAEPKNSSTVGVMSVVRLEAFWDNWSPWCWGKPNPIISTLQDIYLPIWLVTGWRWPGFGQFTLLAGMACSCLIQRVHRCWPVNREEIWVLILNWKKWHDEQIEDVYFCAGGHTTIQPWSYAPRAG